MIKKLFVETPKKGSLVEITGAVKAAVAESGKKEGLVIVTTPDTDAGILLTSFYDPKGHEDIIDDFTRIFPARDNFHFKGSAKEAAAHSMSSVAGQSLDVILHEGELCLGGSQGIFLGEYTGAGTREYVVTVMGFGQ